MAYLATGFVVRQLGSLFEGGSVAGLSDRQLLERFTAQQRCRRRGRLRRAGEPARADGPGRLPAAPGRPPPCRGCLPGRLPGPGPQGPVDPRPRPAGQLAVRGRAPDGTVRQAPARTPAQERGGRFHEAPGSGLVRRGRADGPSGRTAGDRPRAGRGPAPARSTACPGRSACRWCSATSKGSRSTRRRDGSAARPGRSAAGWPGRATSSAAASPAAAWSCPPPPWPRSSTPGPPRRPSHPPCATSRPGPR